MASWDAVRRIAMALPEVTDQPARDGLLQWRVDGKLFAWERPLRPVDLRALGDAAPTGSILATRVADLADKDELLAESPAVYFTTPHFAGYPAILVRLDAATDDDIQELVTHAWLARAPKRLTKPYLAARD